MASRTLAGRLLRFDSARGSPGAMRHESQGLSVTSSVPFEIVTSPSRTT
jgi:hypothetical protein